VGILRITVEESVRIQAIRARVHATITGSSTFAGGTAARTASEVRDLVSALSEHHVGEDAIEVVGIRAENGSGLMAKNQRIEIQLVIDITPDLLPAALGTLTARTGLRIDQLEWVYDEFEASIPATTAALAKARHKATIVAAAAGQRITGIAEISDSWNRASAHGDFGRARAFSVTAAKSAPELDLGLDLNATAQLNVHLNVEFELSD
jgi:hypothetical protein